MASYIFDAVRSPFGRFGKSLAGTRPDDLAAEVIAELLHRNPSVDPAELDEIFMGAANQAGEDNRNVARMASLLAGFPTSVPGATVNRLCGSGMEAVIQASRYVESGDGSMIVAGGVESMTRAPWVLPKPERGFPAANQTLYSSTLGWRMVNPKMDSRWTIALGESAELLASKYDISREQQDEFAVRSHQLASNAWDEGVFEDEVMQISGVTLSRDEGIRSGSSMDSLSELVPAFKADGSVTAGNSSQLSDGAAMLLIGGEEHVGAMEPMARIVSRASVGNDPNIFGVAPVEAANRALQRAGKTWDDVDVVELNEAFASQSLACLQGWPELDPEKVNIHGGAIALGHPLGASGARIIGHLAHELARRGSGVGVAAICIGVGQGLAVVLER